MKIVQINATCGVGSTGKICVDISKLLTQRGIENYILYSAKTSGYPLGISCASKKYIRLQSAKSRLLGNYGFNSRKATQRMIHQLEQIRPDVVHLHNIHGHDCDLEMLFRYFKQKKQRLIWTFHDCWAFTGYCPYFTMIGCEKWQRECHKCPQLRNHSLLLDNSRALFRKKKELFSGLDMTIVTPSVWLAELVKGSFLKDYPVKVINNGIDLSVFCPTDSDLRQKYQIPEDKKVILGVAFDWGIRKGLDVFIRLAKLLNPQKYQIVLVGTNVSIDKQLPREIISIHRTQDQKELAGLYTAADVYVNPTREDNYPTVNMEAIACGTPVVTFRTGGSPEMLEENTGVVMHSEDVLILRNTIVSLLEEGRFTAESCLAGAKSVDKSLKFREYVELYHTLLQKA
jgi:glycosyltransferase involved in cell wall biosynthesis